MILYIIHCLLPVNICRCSHSYITNMSPLLKFFFRLFDIRDGWKLVHWITNYWIRIHIVWSFFFLTNLIPKLYLEFTKIYKIIFDTFNGFKGIQAVRIEILFILKVANIQCFILIKCSEQKARYKKSVIMS